MRLRLRLRKQQARAGDIHLLFADESEALTHPYLAQAWAPRGADLRIEAPGQAKKVAILGALDATTWEVVVHTARTKRSTDFVALLERIDERYGPRPGPGAASTSTPVVLVLDNGPIHISKLTTQALAERQPWLTIEWLPTYAPELNDIERVWRDLKRHHRAHRRFADANQLERDIQSAIGERNRERARLCDKLRIAA